ncbi:MAG: hypothetical protein R3F62_30910 [Planctomycetota bacterium]
MRERRLDPRTDAAFSLRNLLRVRSAQNDYTLAVLGTSEGMVMAGSKLDDAAARAAAEASYELFRQAQQHPYGRYTSKVGSSRLSAIRFEVEGRALLLAVLDREGLQPEQRDEFVLDQLADRVQSILEESARHAA